MKVVFFSALTFISTLLGGLFVVKFKSKLHLIMGFAAGVILGVVFFDVFPEIMTSVSKNNINPIEPMIALVAGFLIFHILEKVILIHHAHEGDYAAHHHPSVGVAGALALAGHSLMDGVGIGLAFHVSNTFGIAIAIAVIAHDYTDGMNTMTFMLGNDNSVCKSKMFLLLDAITPIVGALATFLFTVPEHFLVWYLGFFGGFLLYIGASDILPEAHNNESSLKLIGLTLSGVALIFVITRFV